MSAIAITPRNRELFQARTPAQEDTLSNDIYRSMGNLEGTLKLTLTTLESLVKAQAENNMATVRIEGKMDNMNGDVTRATVTAESAKAEAARANRRLDRIFWTAIGISSACTGVTFLVVSKLYAWWQTIPHIGIQIP